MGDRPESQEFLLAMFNKISDAEVPIIASIVARNQMNKLAKHHGVSHVPASLCIVVHTFAGWWWFTGVYVEHGFKRKMGYNGPGHLLVGFESCMKSRTHQLFTITLQRRFYCLPFFPRCYMKSNGAPAMTHRYVAPFFLAPFLVDLSRHYI